MSADYEEENEEEEEEENILHLDDLKDLTVKVMSFYLSHYMVVNL